MQGKNGSYCRQSFPDVLPPTNNLPTTSLPSNTSAVGSSLPTTNFIKSNITSSNISEVFQSFAGALPDFKFPTIGELPSQNSTPPESPPGFSSESFSNMRFPTNFPSIGNSTSEKEKDLDCSYDKIFFVLKSTVLQRCQTTKSRMLLEV